MLNLPLLFNQLRENEFRISKFVLSGILAATINLVSLFILVNYLNLNTKFLENIANIISIEISIIFNFIINRNWTWRDTERKQGNGLFKQALIFHLIVGGSILLRAILFPLLQLTGVNYLINAIIGIGLGAILNYFLYDKFVFVKKLKSEDR